MDSNPEVLLTGVSRALQRLPRTRRISVAFSGGPDSSVLLEALARLRDKPGSDLPVLRALHVNHGLQRQANAWFAHCESCCRTRGIEFRGLEVFVPRHASQSLEEAARNVRYQALGECLEVGEILCTAQHANDQAETLLLQLLRGAGPRGLAAMPELRNFHAGHLARPMLEIGKDLILDCVRHWNLNVVMDPANADQGFARVRVRQLLLNNILEQFPGALKTLNRSACLQAAASDAIETLASLDSRHCQGSVEGTLAAGQLCRLPQSRRLEVLRNWLRVQDLTIPNQARLLELSRQMTTAGPDRQPLVRWTGGEVRRYRDLIYALGPIVDPQQDFNQHWNPSEELRLPWGRLWSEETTGQGLKAQYTELKVCLRQGGEHCRPVSHGQSRSLKNLFQEHGVPPWQRGRVPLIHTADGLAAVAGLWVCESYQAQAGEPGRLIHWQPY